MAIALLVATVMTGALARAPAGASPLPLGELPTQPLAVGECALVLWERATGRRMAMLVQRPDRIRVFQNGAVKTLPKLAGDTETVAGFAPNARFGDDQVRVTTALAIIANDTAGSAIIRDGVISVTGADGVEVVAPVAGIAGCGS